MTIETQDCGSTFQEWRDEGGMMVAEFGAYRLGLNRPVYDYTASVYSHKVNGRPTYTEKTFRPDCYTSANKARSEALRWIRASLGGAQQ